MQDAHTFYVSVPGKPDYSFFAVFDGHNGVAAARNSAGPGDYGLLSKIMAQPQWKDIDLEGAAGLQALDSAIRGGFIEKDKGLCLVSLGVRIAAECLYALIRANALHLPTLSVQ